MFTRRAFIYRALISLPVGSVCSSRSFAGEHKNLFQKAAVFYGFEDINVLHAISLAETGRTVNGEFVAWPWTLNVNGKGYYYKSKTEAWTKLSEFIVSGVRNVDIGLMQISLRWNELHLVDPYTALDPETNLYIGGRILSLRYRETGNLRKAVGKYHSYGELPEQLARAERYATIVAKHQNKLGSKVS